MTGVQTCALPISGKSFFSKTFNPKHGETLRGKELENQSRKDIKTEPAFVPEGRKPLNLLPRVVEKKAEPPEERKPLNLQPRIGAKKVEQTDNPPSKQSVMAQRLNPRKSVDDDDDRPALELLKTDPPDARSQSLRRATKEGEETIELLQKVMGSQSRPQETDAPPNIRPLIPPTRERSLSNMLNIEETPPPNIPEPIRERSPSPEPIPKKVPEDRLSISEKKMIKRQKAEEEAKERALRAIPEDNFPKKEEEAKERARAAIAERARAAIPEPFDVLMDNFLKTNELGVRKSRGSMEEVIEESRQRQKIPDEDLFKIAKQGRIISSVLPPKPPEPAITEPTPEKEPAYFIDIEPTMELDFRGKEIQETKQKREQPTKVRPRPIVPKRNPITRFISESSLSLDEPERTPTLSPIAPDSRPRGTSLDSVLPRGTSLDSVLSSGTLNRTPSTLQSIREAPSPKVRPRPVVPKRKPKTRFISESSLSLDEPERKPTLSPIPSNTTRPRGTSLDSVLPLRPRGTSLDSILSSGTLNRTPSTLQSIREEPSLKFV